MVKYWKRKMILKYFCFILKGFLNRKFKDEKWKIIK